MVNFKVYQEWRVQVALVLCVFAAFLSDFAVKSSKAFNREEREEVPQRTQRKSKNSSLLGSTYSSFCFPFPGSPAGFS
jgi:hypothetical protein